MRPGLDISDYAEGVPDGVLVYLFKKDLTRHK